MEDCGVTSQELEDLFGGQVARLVDGVTKLTKEELKSGELSQERASSEHDTAQAATVRKMLLSMAEDIRVVLIKLADRMHNMRTLDPLPEKRREAIARETLEIYAPTSPPPGIWEIKWRLEDLAFQHINPKGYQEISKLLSAKRVEREAYIEGSFRRFAVSWGASGSRPSDRETEAHSQYLQQDAALRHPEPLLRRDIRPVRSARPGRRST